MTLKFSVTNIAKYLEKELKSIIPKDKDIFQCFKIFNFKELLHLKGPELGNYGNNEIWKLTNYYLAINQKFVLDKDLVQLEWYNIKLRIVDDIKDKKFERDFCIYILNDTDFKVGYESF